MKSNTSESKKRPGLIRLIFRHLFRLLVALIFLAAAVVILIQTAPGKRMLADGLSRIASSPGTTIGFRRISGFIPFRVRLGELRLGDPEGDWMVIEDARVRLDLLELLSFRLHAERVTVERVTWHRLPGGGPVGGKTAGKPFTPAGIPSFTVDRLAVRNLTVSDSLLGRRSEFSLEGQVSNDAGADSRAELALHPLRRDGGTLSISAAGAADLSRIRAELKLEEDAGGMMGALLFPGSPGPLSFHFRAEGPRRKVETGLALSSGNRFDLRGDFILDLDRLLAEGDLTAAIQEPPLPGWRGQGDLSARLSIEDGGQNLSLRFRGRDLAAPGLLAESILLEAALADIFGNFRGEAGLEADNVATPPSREDDPDPGDLFRHLTARLIIAGDEREPRAELDLNILGYTIPGLVLAPGQRRDINLAGRLAEDRLTIDLKGSGERGFHLQGDLSADASFTTAPLSLSLPGDGELKGSLAAGIPLSFLNNLLALSRQTLGGQAEIELEIGGTWADPSPRGSVVVSNGEYQNLVTGTALHQISAGLKIEDERLELQEFSARTPRPARPLILGWTRLIPGVRFTPLADRTREFPDRGRISLSGRTRLSPSEGYPSSYTLRIEDALLVDTEMFSAIATGEITLEGSLENSLLTGRVKLRHAEGRIPTRVAAAVPEIEVIEINRPEEEKPRPPARPAPILDGISLNLRLTAPDNVIVKGRGLDSEWSADILVTGRAAEPKIRGGLTLLDGIFIFMGEEMRLHDSSVMMDGGYPPLPQLAINARIVKRDIIMNLQVVGPVTQPEVLISSQPPYPDDEILARIIFGRPASQLTGLQALQIANGLRVIQGQPGFFDLLTGLTTFLGTIQVDFTDLEGAEEHDAVRIRWSLSRNFYIENQRSIDSPDNLFLARWEIIRNLQLRVQSGYGMLGDAAFLHWRMDY